jgi:cysteine desulfuration protein SufE
MKIVTKIERLKSQFASLPSREALYQKIMEWGKQLPPFREELKIEKNRVMGCQSVMYLYSYSEKGRVYFGASSDALISAGLAALLIEIYSGEPPDTILITPPTFLEEIGIPAALSPGRVNGLASLYLKMKQEALSYLLDHKT